MFFLGWIIIILNTWAAINTFAHYASNFDLSFLSLLVVNAGSISILILAAGLIIKNHLLLTISVPFLAAYGVFGLFTSSWTQGIPAEQFGNLLMSTAIIYVISLTIKKKAYLEFIIGIVIGMFLLIPFNKMQFDYFQENPDIVQKLGSQKVEEKIPATPLTDEITAEATAIISPEAVIPATNEVL